MRRKVTYIFKKNNKVQKSKKRFVGDRLGMKISIYILVVFVLFHWFDFYSILGVLQGFSQCCAQWCPTLCDPMWPHQAPLPMGWSWQEYWSGLPFPPPGITPDPGIKPASPGVPVLTGRFLPLNHLGSPQSTLDLTLKITIFNWPLNNFWDVTG